MLFSYYAVPKDNHTSPMEDQYKFQGVGGGKSKSEQNGSKLEFQVGEGVNGYFLQQHIDLMNAQFTDSGTVYLQAKKDILLSKKIIIIQRQQHKKQKWHTKCLHQCTFIWQNFTLILNQSIQEDY